MTILKVPDGGTGSRYPKDARFNLSAAPSLATYLVSSLDPELPNAILATAAGLGTVTSVALALPTEFTVSGSPVTTSGTLTGTWATQTANKVFAGPSSGGAATPAFRALAAADLPAHTHASATQGGATLTLVAASAATTPLTITGAASQSANYLTINSSGAVLVSRLTSSGQFYAANGFLLGTGLSTNTVLLTTETVTASQNTIYLPNVEFGTLIVAGSGSDPAGPGEIAKVNLTLNSGTGDVTNRILTNATPAGQYLITAHSTCTGSGTATKTISIAYATDGGTVTPILLNQSMTGGITATASRPVYLSSGNITWSTSGGTFGTIVVRIRVVYLGV